MPIFKTTYVVFHEAFDQAAADRFAPLMCNRMTAALRDASTMIVDEKTVVVHQGPSVAVSPQEHRQALSWSPPAASWEGLRQSTINHIAGA